MQNGTCIFLSAEATTLESEHNGTRCRLEYSEYIDMHGQTLGSKRHKKEHMALMAYGAEWW